MNSKKAIIGIDNFETIKTVLMVDAGEVANNNGAVLYARLEHGADGKSNCGVMIAGDVFSIARCLAKIIYKLHEKTDVSTGVILESVSDLVEVLKNEN